MDLFKDYGLTGVFLIFISLTLESLREGDRGQYFGWVVELAYGSDAMQRDELMNADAL